MTYDSDYAGRARLSPALDINELDRADRILLGACAGIWLLALGAGVAATVALVDMGSGQTEAVVESGTPWLLYLVIAISAVVIVAAVPLLLRARREALAEAEPPERRATETAPPAPPQRGVDAPTEKLSMAGASGPGFAEPRTFGSLTPMMSSPTSQAVDQVSLRFALVVGCAIGIATVAIGVATYLMAVDSTAASWVFYALAGLVTAAMPVLPWYFLRELRARLDSPDG